MGATESANRGSSQRTRSSSQRTKRWHQTPPFTLQKVGIRTTVHRVSRCDGGELFVTSRTFYAMETIKNREPSRTWSRITSGWCQVSLVERGRDQAFSSVCSCHIFLLDFSMSGTPVNTTLMDLKNQLSFLGIQDHSDLMEYFKGSFFRHVNDSSVGKKNDDIPVPGLGLFTFFMRSIMMRHSQNQTYTGTNTTLMSLPPKVSKLLLSIKT
jgi:hypothetical protein